MLREKAIEFFDKKYDLNCAEAILYAANEEYELNLSSQTLHAVASFGGGMGIKSVCGAATGALAVIGIIFTKTSAHKDTIVKDLTIEFMENFKKELSEIDCAYLKEKYNVDETSRCNKMIEVSADILDRIVKENTNRSR